jgi:hypothetical protein
LDPILPYKIADWISHNQSTNVPNSVEYTHVPYLNQGNGIKLHQSSAAFLETRLWNHNQAPSIISTVLGKSAESLQCIYKTVSGKTIYSPISTTPFPTDEEQGDIYSCNVTLSIDKGWDEPVSVLIALISQTLGSIEASFDPIWSNVTVPIESPFPPLVDFETYQNLSLGKLAVCVPPVHGSVPTHAIESFIQTYQKLGVDQFIVYNLSGHDDSMHIFSSYPSVSIIQWSLPPEFKHRKGKLIGKNVQGKDIYTMYNIRKWNLSNLQDYFGQGLAVFDCLHRMIGNARLVAFVDFDEYIVPRQPMAFSLRKIIEKSDRELHSTYSFANTFLKVCMPNNLDTLVPKLESTTSKESLPLFLSTTVRENYIFPQPKRAKVILDPLSTAYHAIHTPRALIKPSVHLKMNTTSTSFEAAEQLWKQRRRKGTFEDYLRNWNEKLPSSRFRVPHEKSVMLHYRWKDEEKKNELCDREKDVIDYTWINLSYDT